MPWVYNLASPDPKSQVPRVIAICLVFPVLALLAVAFRFFVRIRLKRTPWYDDYAVLSSAILVAAYGAVSIAQTRYGLGVHADYFPQENVIPFGKLQYAGGPIYTLALLGFKVSLLAAYIRIGGFVQTYRTVLIVAIVACIANQLIFTFVLLFACHPIAKQWDPTLPGHCINTVKSYYGLAATSIGYDILILSLPIPVLLNLQLHRRQKIALVVIFALGFFVTIIQIIRIFTVKNLKTYTDSKPIIIWSCIEVSIAVISTSIPTYAPYFRAFASNVTSSYHNQTGSSSSQSRRKIYGIPSFVSGRSRSHNPGSTSRGRSTGRSKGTSKGTGTGTTDTDTVTGSNFRSQLQDEYDLEILDDGTTLNKGSGHTTTIMSTSMAAEQRGRESDSEELIQDRNYPVSPGRGNGNGNGHGNFPDHDHGHGEGDTPPGSREDPFHIHTMTEFTVELHDV